MGDPRLKKFTEIICDSLDVVEDDVVLVLGTQGATPLILQLQREIIQRKAFPEIRVTLEQMQYILLKWGETKHLHRFPPGLAKEIELATKLISIESPRNPNQMSRIDQDRLNLWNQTVEPYHARLDFVPTVVTIFPNHYYADKAEMSLEEYENLFYQAVSVDLEKLYSKYSLVEKCLSEGQFFQIKSPDTNLSFELGDRDFTMHSLLINLPDGEIFCSPLEDSVEGYIQFEHASYYGKTFPNLYLEFEKGSLVKFSTDGDKKEFKKLINTDEGACKVGKFGLGINPAIKELTNDILFDEKIARTCNISLGDAYPEVGGTNRSAIHFDIVKDMRPDGQVFMDEKLIYKAGQFKNCI